MDFGRALLLFCLGLLATPQGRVQGTIEPKQTPWYGYQVLQVYPHDTNAFTEGLEYREGYLYESTGLVGHSTVRRVDPATGSVLQQISLNPEYFGEGITVFNHRVIQLTWQTQIGFIYAQATLGQTSTFQYPGEGWALTNDGQHIYMSDGTDQIRIWDPATLAETGRISVHDGSRAITMVNELEYVRGLLYANIWQTNLVAIISPEDGHVAGWVDLTGLLTPEEQAQADVLNGIAYDAAGQRLFVTGKLWPKLFQIQLVPKPGNRHE